MVVAPAALSPVLVVAATGAGDVLALLCTGVSTSVEVAAVVGLDEPDCVVSAELSGARTPADDDTG
jgi:hypothetical protein